LLRYKLFSSIGYDHRKYSGTGIRSWKKTVFIIFGISGVLGALGHILNNRLLENMVLLSAIPYLAGIILLWIEFRRLREFD
jgi:hypothetical protein